MVKIQPFKKNGLCSSNLSFSQREVLKLFQLVCVSKSYKCIHDINKCFYFINKKSKINLKKIIDCTIQCDKTLIDESMGLIKLFFFLEFYNLIEGLISFLLRRLFPYKSSGSPCHLNHTLCFGKTFSSCFCNMIVELKFLPCGRLLVAVTQLNSGIVAFESSNLRQIQTICIVIWVFNAINLNKLDSKSEKDTSFLSTCYF